MWLLFIATAIVVVMVMLWWAGTDARKRGSAATALDASTGGFDQHAREALTAINTMENPAAVDRFARAGLLQYNLLEGNLHRQRHIADTIARDYTAALDGIMRGDVDHDDVDFMILQMEGFGQELVAGQHYLAQPFNEMINTNAPIARAEQIAHRRAQARAATKTAADAATTALDAATTYANDRQNVHDPHVNRDLRTALDKMRDVSVDLDALDDVEKFVRGRYAREFPQKSVAALRTLEIARRGERISTFNEREDVILATVWQRCKHPRNRDNRDLMFEAVGHALADSHDGANAVCINGRTGRVLNSLATLDYDSAVADGAMTYEAYRNQIFQETKNIISDAVERGRRSDDAALRSAAVAYEDGGDDDVTPFTSALKTELAAHVESYADKLSVQERSNIKDEVAMYAGADE